MAKLIPSLLALSLFLANPVDAAVEPILPPDGGSEVLQFDSKAKLAVRKRSVEVKSSWKEIEEMPFSDAFAVEFKKGLPSEKAVQLVASFKDGIKKDDTVLISFWIRRPMSGGEPGPMTACIQAGDPKLRFEYTFSAYREWQQHVRGFKALGALSGEDGKVLFDLGGAGPAVEISGLRVINYGPDVDVATLPKSAISYKGREADAPWRKAALDRIEKIRKADLTIEVVDAKGRPIKNTKVKVEMQRHAFQFGSAVNASILGATQDDLPTIKRAKSDAIKVSWDDVQKYRQVVEDFFNVVTFESELRPHVWKLQHSGNLSWEQKRKVFLDQAIPWLQENDIDVRGHYIAWGAIDYNAIEKEFVGNPKGHRAWLWDYMADVLPKTSGFVSEWDTINHIVGWGKHTYEVEYGGFDIYADLMKEARRLAPNARHTINEGRVLPNGYKREPYKEVIRFLNEHGQAPDTVGFMAHFDLSSLTPPEELLEVFDDFAEIAPRLQLSELDVGAGDDEQLQAEYFRDALIASFSHPNMVGIVQWGFWENAHWKPAAALWRSDWTLKPAGEVFVDLVKSQWWTNLESRTDNAGLCHLRGFMGDYLVTVEHDGKPVVKKFSLNQKSPDLRIVVGK